MTTQKIYSFKANGQGCKVSGRVCAVDMTDATKQVITEVSGYGPMNVSVTELKNQTRAMKEWQSQGQIE